MNDSSPALLLATVVASVYALPPSDEASAENTVSSVVIPGGVTIRGLRINTPRGRTADAYRGIPFAEKPERFLPPTAKQYSSTVDALQCGPVCPQTGAERVMDEDCLSLNVYTPTRGSNLSVLVWIHGGGFSTGSSCGLSQENDLAWAHRAEEQGMVVVSINYRLGAFGFFSSAELKGAWSERPDWSGGFQGGMDALLALKWVNKNIASFRGNADEVTVMGESAGATLVLKLAATPEAKGLVKRAISESGRDLYLNEPAKAQSAVKAITSLSLSELQSMNATRLLLLLQTQGKGTDGYIVTSPNMVSENFRSGQVSITSLMIGTNTADTPLGWPYAPTLLPLFASDSSFPPNSSYVLGAYSTGGVPLILNQSDPHELAAFTEALGRQYPKSSFGDENRAYWAWVASVWHTSVGCTSNLISQFAAPHMPVYTYWAGSSWRGGVFDPVPSGAGSSYDPRSYPGFLTNGSSFPPAGFLEHGGELGYIWPESDQAILTANTSGAGYSLVNALFGKEVRNMNTTTPMQNYWGSFVTDGVPTDKSHKVEWQPLDAANPLASFDNYLYFGDDAGPLWRGRPSSSAFKRPTPSNCNFWAKYLGKYFQRL